MNSTDILQKYDGEDVIILGEDHTENAHNELEEEAIYRTIPRYVLSEGLNDAEPEEFDEMIDDANLMSLRDIQTYFEENYEDSQFLAEDTRELYEEAQEAQPDESPIGMDDGKVPETYNEFMDMPFFRMNREVKDLITDSISDRKDYEMDEWEKWMGEEEPDEFDQKIETLYSVQSAITQISFQMPNSQGSLVRPINHLRREGYNVNLAGCDIDKSEEYSDDSERNFEQPDSASVEEFEEQMREMEENPEKALEDFAKDVEFISELTSDEERDRRDQAMAERISRFDQQNDSGRAIMAVVGANHLDGVVQSLQNQDVSVYAEDLTDVAEPEDDGVSSFLYAMETAERMRK
jgi:pheromone shutdown protein TraB